MGEVAVVVGVVEGGPQRLVGGERGEELVVALAVLVEAGEEGVPLEDLTSSPRAISRLYPRSRWPSTSRATVVLLAPGV